MPERIKLKRREERKLKKAILKEYDAGVKAILRERKEDRAALHSGYLSAFSRIAEKKTASGDVAKAKKEDKRLDALTEKMLDAERKMIVIKMKKECGFLIGKREERILRKYRERRADFQMDLTADAAHDAAVLERRVSAIYARQEGRPETLAAASAAVANDKRARFFTARAKHIRKVQIPPFDAYVAKEGAGWKNPAEKLAQQKQAAPFVKESDAIASQEKAVKATAKERYKREVSLPLSHHTAVPESMATMENETEKKEQVKER